MILSNNKGVSLRDFHERDIPVLAEIANNKRIWDNVRDYFPNPYSEEDARGFIDFCKNENPQVTFAIEYKNELAGVAGLIPQADVHRLSAEIGYWIGEQYWGKGIATNSVELLKRYAFEELKLVRLYCGIFDFNKASQRVIEKAGFIREAVLRKSVIKNGLICDEYRYSCLSEQIPL